MYRKSKNIQVLRSEILIIFFQWISWSGLLTTDSQHNWIPAGFTLTTSRSNALVLTANGNLELQKVIFGSRNKVLRKLHFFFLFCSPHKHFSWMVFLFPMRNPMANSRAVYNVQLFYYLLGGFFISLPLFLIIRYSINLMRKIRGTIFF